MIYIYKIIIKWVFTNVKYIKKVNTLKLAQKEETGWKEDSASSVRESKRLSVCPSDLDSF